MVDVIRSPRQATTIYGMDGVNIPRKKSLFYVRFCRTDNGQATVDGGWQDNMGFLLKSIDRPAESPIIEEINQYNKKRHIITGVKYQDMKMTLYDTIDSTVMKMWDEYTRYYFGDYNQEDERQFDYDSTLPEMYDNGAGFGYVPRKLDASVDTKSQSTVDLNSQYFFDRIEVYQVFGNNFVQFDLINPKIISFNPDELDYEQTTISTINITFVYESILRRNGGKALPISNNEFVSAAFRNQFNGSTLDVGPSQLRTDIWGNQTDTITTNSTGNIYKDFLSSQTSADQNILFSKNIISNDFLNYGKYDFGSIGSSTYKQADGSYLVSGNQNLAAALGYNNKSISSTLVETTNAKLEGSAKNSFGADYLKSNISGGVIGGALLGGYSPLSGIVSKAVSGSSVTSEDVRNTAVNAVASTPSARKGLSLVSQSYAIINATKSLRSQIGFKL